MLYRIGRRSLIGAATAYLISPGPAAATASWQSRATAPSLLIAASGTVSLFAWRLWECHNHQPQPWYARLCDDLERNVDSRALPVVSPKTERRQAAYFARLALTHVVPFYLRYAGLHHLAAGLTFPEDFKPASLAAHGLIGAFHPSEPFDEEEHGWHPNMPALHRVAYIAALHAGNACFAAVQDDDFMMAGQWLALALQSAFMDAENPPSREAFDCTPLWDFALTAIIEAQRLDDDNIA